MAFSEKTPPVVAARAVRMASAVVTVVGTSSLPLERGPAQSVTLTAFYQAISTKRASASAEAFIESR